MGILVERHRFQTLAMMVCEAWSVTDIAAAMCLPEETVKKYTSPEAPETFKKILKGYREKFERYSIERRFRMADMAEQSYDNIKNALISNDTKLKTETAWRVLDEVAPKPVEETAPGVSVNVNLTRNNQVNAQIVELGQNLFEEFQSLKELPGTSYDRHLKMGSEALPSSYQEVQAETAEAVPGQYPGNGKEKEKASVGEGEPRPEEAE